ncbi:MAG: hypothetical protein WKG07_36245 [Hymenobacter sp.]
MLHAQTRPAAGPQAAYPRHPPPSPPHRKGHARGAAEGRRMSWRGRRRPNGVKIRKLLGNVGFQAAGRAAVLRFGLPVPERNEIEAFSNVRIVQSDTDDHHRRPRLLQRQPARWPA